MALVLTQSPKLEKALKIVSFTDKDDKEIKFSDNIKFSNNNKFITLKNAFKTKYDVVNLSSVNDSDKEMIVHMAAKYTYSFDKYINKPNKKNLIIYDKNLTTSTKNIVKKHNDIYFTRDIINEPSNIATPLYISKLVKKYIRGVKINIYDESDLLKHKLNLIHAVGKASTNKPKFVVMEYKCKNPKAKTICLCGKGVTFDAGGVNIKTGKNNSYAMKGDKTGGCIVIGMMKHFSDIKINCNVIGLVPLVENVISGSALKPGDIIKSYSGKTVEIINTDAEGRLILADALSFCEKYNPDYIFDFATLTGWANTLHCDTSAIYFSANNKLHALIEDVGENIGERTWGMPKWLDYMQYCKSEVADLKNHDFNVNGCPFGSGFMATMFLAHFVPKKCLRKWVHFDICNNINNHIMNANTMNLAIEVIKKLVNNK